MCVLLWSLGGAAACRACAVALLGSAALTLGREGGTQSRHCAQKRCPVAFESLEFGFGYADMCLAFFCHIGGLSSGCE
jgi:hypothetical protein